MAGLRSKATAVIEVAPAAAIAERTRLLFALAEACRVSFVPSGSVATSDGELRFPGAGDGGSGSDERPAHVMIADEEPGADAVEVQLDPATGPRQLAGCRITDSHLPASFVIEPRRGFDPVACGRDRPLWVADGRRSVAVAAPLELAPGERLRDRFGDGRFLALLALVEWLRTAAGIVTSDPRAAFLFDDPNLHSLRYGHIDFREVADWTRRTGAHVAFATIPLDLWYASPAAVRLFLETPGLSLLMHGNNHLRHELAIDAATRTRAAWMRTALRRVGRFERRTGLTVDRVMAPPHGRCSEPMARTMRDLGIEGLCVSRPYPWPAPAAADDALVGWRPGEPAIEGFQTIPRCTLDVEAAELSFRSYLGQPLILFGHHDSFAGGLDLLERRRAEIARLGAVRWLSIEEIARSNFRAAIRGRTMEVLPFGGRAAIDVPDRVGEVRFERPRDGRDTPGIAEVDGSRVAVARGEALPVPAGRSRIELAAPASAAATRESGPAWTASSRTWHAVPRRIATESRDRVQGWLGRRRVGRPRQPPANA